VADAITVLWAVVPPLLLLAYYYYRAGNSPLTRLLLFFAVGAICGFVSLNLEWGFEYLANSVTNWRKITRSLTGVALRQLLEVAPIEEGCKFFGVVFTTGYLKRWYHLRPNRSSFLYFIALACGFTAQENWVYLSHDTASIFDRLIGTPVQAMFSAPWGYALAASSASFLSKNNNWKAVVLAWLYGVGCHALANILSSAWHYPAPLGLLSYGFFPFLLWMFWRFEQLFLNSQNYRSVNLISGYSFLHRLWQRGLIVFALILGGNAIFGLFLLARMLIPLSLSQLLYPVLMWFIIRHCLLNLVCGLLAWGIYLYLRHFAGRRSF
jgi:RsiW-degrading membrane proteinase PrsW (M82 family)